MRACEKRPVSSEIINKSVQEIENELRKKGKIDVESKLIGSLVMNKLKNLDQVAYIRFASVYKDFQDVDSFKEEINKIR